MSKCLGLNIICLVFAIKEEKKNMKKGSFPGVPGSVVKDGRLEVVHVV